LKQKKLLYTFASSSSEESSLALMTAATTLNLGFLTVVRDANGFLGGYLVTNQWGRPVEFRLSTAVQPNRVQKILYGDTLEPYLCAEVIGKTLVDKAGVPAELLVTDCRPVLDLRLRVETPVLWLAQTCGIDELGCMKPAAEDKPGLFRHPSIPTDEAAIQRLLQRLDGAFDLAEPFNRIREAIGEARTMGVANRG
jgi:hypothetical protein